MEQPRTSDFRKYSPSNTPRVETSRATLKDKFAQWKSSIKVKYYRLKFQNNSLLIESSPRFSAVTAAFTTNIEAQIASCTSIEKLYAMGLQLDENFRIDKLSKVAYSLLHHAILERASTLKQEVVYSNDLFEYFWGINYNCLCTCDAFNLVLKGGPCSHTIYGLGPYNLSKKGTHYEVTDNIAFASQRGGGAGCTKAFTPVPIETNRPFDTVTVSLPNVPPFTSADDVRNFENQFDTTQTYQQ